MLYADFFGTKISKLITGDNPITGHSYIESVTTGNAMLEYYTAENILKAMFEMEELGISAMLPLADPFVIRVLKEYRRAGGKINFIFQPYMPMDQKVSVRQMMELEPIGIYHQGTLTDYNYESGLNDETRKLIDFYHKEMGIPVGIGTHVPEVIELSEREGWNVDFYMACMQNARKGREGEQSGFITGKSKEHLTFFPEDRPVMLNTLRKISKPVIAYKIFAGGQMFLGRSDEQIREAVKGAYEEVFSALKPDDVGCIGFFQRDKDELREDVEVFNEWTAGKA